MSRSSTFFVLFSKPVSLEDAANALRGAGIVFEKTHEGLVVKHHGVEMDVGLATGLHIAEESQELAARLHVPSASRCTRRFEVFVVDLSVALDEFGTLQAVQQTLLDLTEGIAWLQWNDGIV